MHLVSPHIRNPSLTEDRVSDRTDQRSIRSDTDIHVGLIMDGNGRWAESRGRPRTYGHKRGVAALRRIVEAAPRHGVRVLTLYAFSSDNWKRPAREVKLLMGLMRHYLQNEAEHCRENGVRLNVIGRRDRLPENLLRAVQRAETITGPANDLILRFAVDYSGRYIVEKAAELWAGGRGASDAMPFRRAIERAMHADPEVPDIDLLIRSGGEQRLSDFMPWESAYAELWFSPVLWPDFSVRDFRAALSAFSHRQRRYGGLNGQKPRTFTPPHFSRKGSIHDREASNILQDGH